MKEELESLGFKKVTENIPYYILDITDILFVEVSHNGVKICEHINYTYKTFLFRYDLEKLKTLINLLK